MNSFKGNSRLEMKYFVNKHDRCEPDEIFCCISCFENEIENKGIIKGLVVGIGLCVSIILLL